jgi:hypothetical protein
MLGEMGDHHRTRGVLYAKTNDGNELPVVDLTHPAFAQRYDDVQIAKKLRSFEQAERARARIPKPIQRVMLGWAARHSRLARALFLASEGAVGGMTLYAAKLGPKMLGDALPGLIDRWIAGSPASWLTRIRLADMARLIAEGLVPALSVASGRPLHLFNIAGGPAADSWNALLLLKREGRVDLRSRKIAIHVLDRDEEGPAFGARAVSALKGDGAPLGGLDLTFRRVAYDWRNVSELRTVLEEAGVAGAAVAVSSEGGLFEYGTDDEIVANLDVLRDTTPPDGIVVGSVTRAEGPAAFLDLFTVRPRTLAAFRLLTERAGWAVARVIERPFSYDVCLSRMI